MTEIILATLATYGIATLLAEYPGPFNIFEKARERLSAPQFACNVCLGVLIAIPLAIALNLSLVEYFAVVGSVVALARAT